MFKLNKIAAIALVSTIGLAGVASAENYIGLQENVMADGYVTIKTVTVDQPGTLAIYDYQGGTFGDLLGTAPLTMGANDAVKVQLDKQLIADHSVAAVVYAGPVTTPDQAVYWEDLGVMNQ